MTGNLTKLDVLQVRAFHAAYKLLHDLPVNERFITAIAQTSDDMFAKADKVKIEQWIEQYSNRVYKYNKSTIGTRKWPETLQ